MLEDDNAFAEALTELLEADGRIEVAGRASEGREGVDLVDALEPDVVLTDIALPVLDGVEATREILRRHPGMPVVAMTGWEYEERALEVRAAGAVDYVSKSRLGPRPDRGACCGRARTPRRAQRPVDGVTTTRSPRRSAASTGESGDTSRRALPAHHGRRSRMGPDRTRYARLRGALTRFRFGWAGSDP